MGTRQFLSLEVRKRMNSNTGTRKERENLGREKIGRRCKDIRYLHAHTF